MCEGAAAEVRSRAGPGAPGVGADPRSPAAPGAPARWAEKMHTVLVIFPGNLSFRRYTCASLVGGATPERVFFSWFVLDLGFRELPSPPPNGGGESFPIDTLHQGPTIVYPLKFRESLLFVHSCHS